MKKRAFRRLVAAEAAVAAILAFTLADATAFAARLDTLETKPSRVISIEAPPAVVDSPVEEPQPAEEWVSIGSFKLTFYCPCRKCSGSWGRSTSTGAICTEGRTIAVDPRVIPYGTEVRIGDHIFVAEDRGGSIKGKRIDVFMEDHGACLDAGVQRSEIYIKKSKED